MKKQDSHSRALSEVSSEILVIALVLVLAVVIYVLVFGGIDPSYTKKSVYVGGTANVLDIPRSSGLSDHVITFLPKAGDKFYLTGQNTAGTSGTRTTLRLVTPEGISVYPRTGSLTGDPYGKQLYIYPNNSGSGIGVGSTGVYQLRASLATPQGGIQVRSMETMVYTDAGENNDTILVEGTSFDDDLTVALLNNNSSALVFLNGNPYTSSRGVAVPGD